MAAEMLSDNEIQPVDIPPCIVPMLQGGGNRAANYKTEIQFHKVR